MEAKILNIRNSINSEKWKYYLIQVGDYIVEVFGDDETQAKASAIELAEAETQEV